MLFQLFNVLANVEHNMPSGALGRGVLWQRTVFYSDVSDHEFVLVDVHVDVLVNLNSFGFFLFPFILS